MTMARFHSGGCLEQHQPLCSHRNDETKDGDKRIGKKKLLRLDPSLADVLGRLIDAIDLSSSPPHEIVEGLASHGITTWQSFVLTDEDYIKRIPLSLTSAKLLIHLKEMVMDNLQKGVANAKVPTLYTKKKYEDYVIRVNLSKRKKDDIDDSSSRIALGRTSNSDLEASKPNATPFVNCANPPCGILEDGRTKAPKQSMDFNCNVDSNSVCTSVQLAASGTTAPENNRNQDMRTYPKECSYNDDIYCESILREIRPLEAKVLQLRQHQQQLQVIMKVEFDALQSDFDDLKNLIQETKDSNTHELCSRRLRSLEATSRQLRQSQQQLQEIMKARLDRIQFRINSNQENCGIFQDGRTKASKGPLGLDCDFDSDPVNVRLPVAATETWALENTENQEMRADHEECKLHRITRTLDKIMVCLLLKQQQFAPMVQVSVDDGTEISTLTPVDVHVQEQ